MYVCMYYVYTLCMYILYVYVCTYVRIYVYVRMYVCMYELNTTIHSCIHTITQTHTHYINIHSCAVCVLKVSAATHNIFAYRFTCPLTRILHHDCDDDGETAAGARLAELLRLMHLDGVAVIVSRVSYLYVCMYSMYEYMYVFMYSMYECM